MSKNDSHTAARLMFGANKTKPQPWAECGPRSRACVVTIVNAADHHAAPGNWWWGGRCRLDPQCDNPPPGTDRTSPPPDTVPYRRRRRPRSALPPSSSTALAGYGVATGSSRSACSWPPMVPVAAIWPTSLILLPNSLILRAVTPEPGRRRSFRSYITPPV